MRQTQTQAQISDQVELFKQKLIEQAKRLVHERIGFDLATNTKRTTDNLAHIYASYRMKGIKIVEVRGVESILEQGWSFDELKFSISYEIPPVTKEIRYSIMATAPNGKTINIYALTEEIYPAELNKEEFKKFIEYKEEFKNKYESVRKLAERVKELEEELEECNKNDEEEEDP